MKIKVIGCGSAFSKRNFHQSFLLTEGDHRMLIDCGSKVPDALDCHGIDLKSIDSIYISHLHADHIGGLEEVAFRRYDWLNRPIKAFQEENSIQNAIPNSHYAPILLGNEQLIKDLWDKSLRGGLESMEGFPSSLETFFRVKPIKSNEKVKFGNWTIELIQQVHIMTGSTITHTFGVMISSPNRPTVYFTTDSQHCSPKQMKVFYKRADIIFQDCELIGVDTEKAESKFTSGVHANYAELAGYHNANAELLASDTKSKMWLSHYQDLYNEDLDSFGNSLKWDDLAILDGFKGFVKLGQEFEI